MGSFYPGRCPGLCASAPSGRAIYEFCTPSPEIAKRVSISLSLRSFVVYLQCKQHKFLPVYTICFMNYMPRTDEVSKFRTDIVLADKDTKMQVSNKIRFIYLALPLFKNKAEECVTDFEKWIYVLKHMEALSRMPFTAQKEIFKQLEDYADSHRLTKKEWEAYENSLWVVRDNMACMAAAEREAREKGRAEGRAEEKKTIARNLLAMGLTIEQVAQGSGLPIEEVKSLQ